MAFKTMEKHEPQDARNIYAFQAKIDEFKEAPTARNFSEVLREFKDDYFCTKKNYDKIIDALEYANSNRNRKIGSEFNLIQLNLMLDDLGRTVEHIKQEKIGEWEKLPDYHQITFKPKIPQNKEPDGGFFK